jgi:hypothetical protein
MCSLGSIASSPHAVMHSQGSPKSRLSSRRLAIKSTPFHAVPQSVVSAPVAALSMRVTLPQSYPLSTLDSLNIIGYNTTVLAWQTRMNCFQASNRLARTCSKPTLVGAGCPTSGTCILPRLGRSYLLWQQFSPRAAASRS